MGLKITQIVDDVLQHDGLETTVICVCGYVNHVEHLSRETDFKLAFCEVRQEVAENLTFPEPMNTNGTGMTFK